MKTDAIQKFAIFLTVLVGVAGLFLVTIQASRPMSYPDFITGSITWNAQSKFQDLIVMPVIIFGGFFLFIILNNFFEKFNELNLVESKKISQHIILWSLPAFATLSGMLASAGFEDNLVWISLFCISNVIIFAWILEKKYGQFDIENVSVGLLMVLLFALAPLCAAGVINISPFGLNESVIGSDEIKKWTIFFLFIGFVLFGYIVIFRHDTYHRALTRIIPIAQCGLPLLFVTLYPKKLVDSGGVISIYDTTILLKILVGGLVCAGYIDILFRYMKSKNSENIKKLISPFAIVALIIALKFGNTTIPAISPDDYHFGESLLGWWAYFQGYIPYIDYIPQHGLIPDDFPGLLNKLFYDGTAVSQGESRRLAFAFFTIIGFFSIYAFTDSLLIAFLSGYFVGASTIWGFVIPFTTTLFSKNFIENKIKWSIAFFIFAPIIILGIPPQGILLVAALGIIPLYFAWIVLREREWISLAKVLAAFLIFLVIYWVSPLGQMLIGAIKYVLINGPINQATYGVPWMAYVDRNKILFEVIKMTWVVVPGVMLIALYILYQTKRFVPNLVLPLIVTFVFALLLIPYSMGRIDPGSLSRPGIAGLLLIPGFMILVVFNIMDNYRRTWLLVGVVFLSSLLTVVPISLSPLLGATAPSINVGQLRTIENGLLKNIGNGQVEEAQWVRLNKLAKILDQKLAPNETFLNLTSRNAIYFYLDRLPPIPITAPYNMPSPTQQIQAIEILQRKLPRLALLEAENIVHDGGGLALRSYHLYRFAVENYEPFEIDGFVVGLSKEALKRGDWGDMPLPDQATKVALFQKSFSMPVLDYQKIPVSWGQSLSSLKSKMDLIRSHDEMPIADSFDLELLAENQYKIVGNDPFIQYDLSKNMIGGQDVSFLKFDFSCDSRSQEPKIQVFWWGDDQAGVTEENSLTFTADDGALIVPLDTTPRWLLLNKINGIRVDLQNPEACLSFSINNIALYKRNGEY